MLQWTSNFLTKGMIDMAEITSAGYSSLRSLVKEHWNYIELVDSVGTAILRLPTTDSRVTWADDVDGKSVNLTVIVKGNNTELSSSLPKTFAGVKIFGQETGGDAFVSETFTEFSMTNEEDQLTVVAKVTIPYTV